MRPRSREKERESKIGRSCAEALLCRCYLYRHDRSATSRGLSPFNQWRQPRSVARYTARKNPPACEPAGRNPVRITNRFLAVDRHHVRRDARQIYRPAIGPPHVACARIGWRLRLPREVARRALLAVVAHAERPSFLIDGGHAP